MSAAPPPRAPGPARPRRRTGPNGRAALGALLVAAALVGVFASHERAERGPAGRAVVAKVPVALGHELTAADLELVRVELPGASADRAFETVAEVEGAVALAPLASGELVQRSSVLTDDLAPAGATTRSQGSRELSLTLPGDRALDGVVQPGERVDVLATHGTGPDAYTAVVSRAALVRRVGATSAGSLGSTGTIALTLGLRSADEVMRLVHAREVGSLTLVRATRADGDGDDHGPETYRAVPPR